MTWSSYPGFAVVNAASTTTAVVAATDAVVNAPPSPDGGMTSGAIVAVGSMLVSLASMLIPVVLGFLKSKRAQDREFALQTEADEESKSVKIGRLLQQVGFLESQVETLNRQIGTLNDQIKALSGQIESMTRERGDLMRRLGKSVTDSTEPV